jgi:hypothetical protein
LAALADLSDIAGRLSEALSRASIPHAIGGAVALVAHGVVRATADVDARRARKFRPLRPPRPRRPSRKRERGTPRAT